MKYIRTKDAIFKVTSKAGNIYCVTNQNNDFIIVNERAVDNQADTIEELCDEFVVKDINGKYTYIDNEKPWMNYKNCVIYGAIWTSKGLIYVAKMNEKGELELL